MNCPKECFIHLFFFAARHSFARHVERLRSRCIVVNYCIIGSVAICMGNQYVSITQQQNVQIYGVRRLMSDMTMMLGVSTSRYRQIVKALLYACWSLATPIVLMVCLLNTHSLVNYNISKHHCSILHSMHQSQKIRLFSRLEHCE